jgi:aryl-alcohol dehydrogenase-like predicted oxidoreductase
MGRGVNFFDNAEAYALGKSEEIMGEVLKKLAWPRMKVVVSTKFYWGLNDGPNERNTLNRKYLLHGIDASLKRLQLDYVDLVYCHRPDPNTPIEETVWAMHDMIARGKGASIGAPRSGAPPISSHAWRSPRRHHLHKCTIVEQHEYNPFTASAWRRNTRPFTVSPSAALWDTESAWDYTTWSPPRSGLLTGKYRNGIPQGRACGSIRA